MSLTGRSLDFSSPNDLLGWGRQRCVKYRRQSVRQPRPCSSSADVSSDSERGGPLLVFEGAVSMPLASDRSCPHPALMGVHGPLHSACSSRQALLAGDPWQRLFQLPDAPPQHGSYGAAQSLSITSHEALSDAAVLV